MSKQRSEPTPPPSGELLIYESEDGRVKLDVRLERETLWLTQADMARLLDCSSDNISLHLKNVYQEGELAPGQLPRNPRQFGSLKTNDE